MAEQELKDPQEFNLTRTPILLSPHTVAVITLFHLPHDKIEDIWIHEYVDAINEINHAADQFVKQLEDHWSPAFLMALRKRITTELEKHDRECGTNFAQRDE